MILDKFLRESSVNLISRVTNWVNGKFCELWFSLLFVIFSEKLANIWVISFEIAKMTGFGREQDFTL